MFQKKIRYLHLVLYVTLDSIVHLLNFQRTKSCRFKLSLLTKGDDQMVLTIVCDSLGIHRKGLCCVDLPTNLMEFPSAMISSALHWCCSLGNCYPSYNMNCSE